MNLIIKHVEQSGNLKERVLSNVYDVTLDIGYEHEEETIPAVKIHRKDQNAYYLLHVYQAEELVQKLKLEVCKTGTLELPASIFDYSEISDDEAATLMFHLSPRVLLNQVFTRVGYSTIYKSDAWKPFSTEEKQMLINENLKPINKRHVPTLAELWRRTLPTPRRPQGVSKYQYFETLIDSLRNYR